MAPALATVVLCTAGGCITSQPWDCKMWHARHRYNSPAPTVRMASATNVSAASTEHDSNERSNESTIATPRMEDELAWSSPPTTTPSHLPVPRSLAAEMGNPRCVFVTGGPRDYAPGIGCVGNRLRQVGSVHPLLVVVEPEEESYMRRHVPLGHFPRGSRLVPWRRFPMPYNACYQ